MKYAVLILCNLGRKKIRTLLTALSIVVAFVLFAYLSAIRAGLSQGVEVAGADRLVVRHKVSLIIPLPESYGERMARTPGVDAVVYSSWFGGIYQDPKNFFAQIVVDPAPFLDMYPEYVLPDEQRKAWLDTRTGAIAGRKLAERFGWSVGDRIPIQATIWLREGGSQAWEFDLVGIYDGAEKGTDETQFFFRHDYFEEARANGKGQVGWYVIRVHDPEQAVDVAAAIDAEFANSFAETKAEPEGAFVQGFAKQIGNIGAIMIAIMSAVFFTILLVAGNTMSQSVRERLAELAVLKALGFGHDTVMGLVLAESCVLAGTAGAIGLALGYFLVSLGNPTGGALPSFYVPVADLFAGAALVVGLGAAAGFLPATQALRLRIADGMRRG